MKRDSITSEHTAVNQLPAVAKLVARRFGWRPYTKHLDIGAGPYDGLGRFLRARRVEYYPYDTYNRTAAENRIAMEGRYDTVTLSNLLNVVRSEDIRHELLRLAHKKLLHDGKAYITVYEGDRTGFGGTTSKGWQENRRTADYLDEIGEVFSGVERFGRLIVAVKK